MHTSSKPLVSIVIPSYNHAQYIETAVESALNQTYDNIEILIVDDGSKDNSRELLQEKYGDHKRIRLFLNKENRGHAVTLNETLKEIRSDYISWLSSDDWYLPNKIEKQMDKFLTLDASYGCVYSGGYRYFEDTGEMRAVRPSMRSGHILKELLTEPFFIYPISPLLRKECLLKYPFTPKYKAEGEAIHFKIAMKYKYDYVDDLLVVMRDHTYNIGKNIELMLQDNIAYHQELFEHPDFPDELKYLKSQVLSKIYALKGWELIRIRKNYKLGQEALRGAIKEDVTKVFNPRVMLGLIFSTFKR